jgi:hypothetical protein
LRFIAITEQPIARAAAVLSGRLVYPSGSANRREDASVFQERATFKFERKGTQDMTTLAELVKSRDPGRSPEIEAAARRASSQFSVAAEFARRCQGSFAAELSARAEQSLHQARRSFLEAQTSSLDAHRSRMADMANVVSSLAILQAADSQSTVARCMADIKQAERDRFESGMPLVRLTDPHYCPRCVRF